MSAIKDGREDQTHANKCQGAPARPACSVQALGGRLLHKNPFLSDFPKQGIATVHLRDQLDLYDAKISDLD